MMRFVVVACSPCGKPWATESRFHTVRRPRCRRSYPLAERTVLWEGDDGRQAQVAAGLIAEREARQ